MLARLVLRYVRGRDLPGPLGVQFWILGLTASLLRESVRESKCVLLIALAQQPNDYISETTGLLKSISPIVPSG